MKQTLSTIVTVALIFGLGYLLVTDSTLKKESADTTAGVTSNIEIKDGVQYITIEAKGGYSPRLTTAQADVPTKLLVTTNNTFDCSSALVIPDLNFEKFLQPTGTETIDIGTYKAGKKLQVLCAMGMYYFTVEFK